MKIINHEANGLQVSQRIEDGYMNLTQMAKNNDKLIADYLRLDTTKAFIDKLSTVMGIPITGKKGLIQIKQGGNDKNAQGTWGHPKVAIHCAMWCDTEFAVFVINLVFEWMTTGNNPISQQSTGNPVDLLTELEQLENLIIGIRSQARTFHTGSHQPADEHLVKSLHTISHNQLNIINSAIERLQRLKQVAEMNSELEINADIKREEPLNPVTGIPVTANEPNQQSPSTPAMKNITAANFIDSIPVVTKEATVRFTVDLPESMHRKLSILSARTGRSKADIIRMVLDDVLKDVEE
jgi:hypothetical protein